MSVTARQLINFAIGALAFAAFAHAAFATVAAAGLDRLYRDRMFDVRRWPGDSAEGLALAGTYLRERSSRLDAPVTVFAGSSLTRGYPWTARQTFTWLYQDLRGTATINAGILGLDVTGVHDWIICAATANQLHFDTLIVEIPVVNTIAELVRNHDAPFRGPAIQACPPVGATRGFSHLAWSKPLGVGWFAFLWDVDAYSKPDLMMRAEPVPAGYFARMRDYANVSQLYQATVAATLKSAAAIADHVYAFPSPVFVAGLDGIGEDSQSVRLQLAQSVDACHQSGAACIDTRPLGERGDYFFNFTHLNQAGHRALAALLNQQVH